MNLWIRALYRTIFLLLATRGSNDWMVLRAIAIVVRIGAFSLVIGVARFSRNLSPDEYLKSSFTHIVLTTSWSNVGMLLRAITIVIFRIGTFSLVVYVINFFRKLSPVSLNSSFTTQYWTIFFWNSCEQGWNASANNHNCGQINGNVETITFVSDGVEDIIRLQCCFSSSSYLCIAAI